MKAKIKSIDTREEAELEMESLAAATISHAAIAADMNAELQKVRDRYGMELAEDSMAIEEHTKRLKAWAKRKENRPTDGKTIEMVHGAIEYADTPPSCRLRPGRTWDAVKAVLINHDLGYIRTVIEPDKEKLIADRELLDEKFLVEVGILFGSDERITVKPKIEDGVVTVTA